MTPSHPRSFGMPRGPALPPASPLLKRRRIEPHLPTPHVMSMTTRVWSLDTPAPSPHPHQPDAADGEGLVGSALDVLDAQHVGLQGAERKKETQSERKKGRGQEQKGRAQPHRLSVPPPLPHH